MAMHQRLPNPFTRTPSSTIKLWAKQAADATRATVTITETGEYDTLAE